MASGQPSELHKLGAQIFVYGFHSERDDRIILAIAVDVALLQWKLSHHELVYERGNRLDQTFIGLQYRALQDIGAILFIHDARAEEATV